MEGQGDRDHGGASLGARDPEATVDGLHHTFHRLKWAKRGGESWEKDWGAPPSLASMSGKPFARYPLLEPSLANFVHNVLEGKPPAATIDDGRENVEICLGVLESARTHQPVAIRQLAVR